MPMYICVITFSFIGLKEELQTLKKKILEMSSVTGSKGNLLTTYVVYYLVLSCM